MMQSLDIQTLAEEFNYLTSESLASLIDSGDEEDRALVRSFITSIRGFAAALERRLDKTEAAA